MSCYAQMVHQSKEKLSRADPEPEKPKAPSLLDQVSVITDVLGNQGLYKCKNDSSVVESVTVEWISDEELRSMRRHWHSMIAFLVIVKCKKIKGAEGSWEWRYLMGFHAKGGSYTPSGCVNTSKLRYGTPEEPLSRDLSGKAWRPTSFVEKPTLGAILTRVGSWIQGIDWWKGNIT